MSKITLLNEPYNLKWDEYIRQSSAGAFYHGTEWKSIIERTFGFRPIYLIALSEAGDITGVLPMFIMKDFLGRKYLISSPSSNYAGVCANDSKIKRDLINKAKDIAIENKVHYMEIRQFAEEYDKLPTKKDFVTMFLKLDADEEYVWKKLLNSKARNQIRKANREGLTIDFGKQYLADFYRVISTNFRDHGSPIYPKGLFSNILEEFGDSANLIVVKYHDQIIGGMLFIGYKEVFSMPWAASLREYRNLCPDNMLYWEAIKYACINGFKWFDFGRSTFDSGTYNFKKQWGAKPIQLQYQYFLNKAQQIPEVSANNNKYQIAINLWKKLPLVVANTLGPRLIRYLPEL